MSYYLGKLALLICLLLAACAGIEPAQVATDGPGLPATASPRPVSTQPTPTLTPGSEPTSTLTQAVETATATPPPEKTTQVVEPSPSLTPRKSTSETTQPAASQAAIQIFSLGEGFQVTSPLTVAANLNGLVQGAYRVELFGRDGRLLYRQVWGKPGQAILGLPLDLEILFQIPADEEEGRLVITRLDDNNRLQTVESSDLRLLSNGTDSGREGAGRTYLQVIQDSILIQVPLEAGQAAGGMVRVAGRTRATVGEVLRIQLVNEEGKVVGQRVASVEAGEEGQGIFSSEVPYKVEATMPVRLVVFALGDPVSPFRYLASRIVVLAP